MFYIKLHTPEYSIIFRMMIIDYLLSYILLLIALHFMYLFYILSFTFNTIVMIHSDSVSSIPFNTTL